MVGGDNSYVVYHLLHLQDVASEAGISTPAQQDGKIEQGGRENLLVFVPGYVDAGVALAELVPLLVDE